MYTCGATVCPVVSSIQNLMLMLDSAIEVVPVLVIEKESCAWFAPQESVVTCHCNAGTAVSNAGTAVTDATTSRDCLVSLEQAPTERTASKNKHHPERRPKLGRPRFARFTFRR